MPENIKLSVVIPVYNAEKHLRQCLDSVANQTLRELEILCIDDGSSDSSGQILDEYAARDSRFVVIHQANAGQSVARNLGLDTARGEFIAFLDADDWLELNAYETVYNTIMEDGNTADFAFFAYRWIDFPPMKDVPLATQAVYLTDFERIQTVRSNFYVMWNRVHRRSFLLENQLRFPVGLNFEDTSFSFLTALAAKRVLGVPHYFYNYRYAGYSTDPRQSYKHMDLIEIWQLIVDKTRQGGYSADVEKFLTQEKFMACAHVYRREISDEYKPECCRRIRAVITPDEWQRFNAGKLRISSKARRFFYWLEGGWGYTILRMMRYFFLRY